MKRISEAANVTPIRFHDIRHTHASVLISEGVDIVKVQTRLGHSKPSITLEHYAHMMPNQDDEVADIFHNALSEDPLAKCEQITIVDLNASSKTK
ncbi:tyrosine-type recombinase/integrase [Peribacillus simplex]|uniref:tyrosine-type recombinase/integrase n=1 Tax=Peribacillus simplex TaxID=1478 RepID=UPI003D2AE7CF